MWRLLFLADLPQNNKKFQNWKTDNGHLQLFIYTDRWITTKAEERLSTGRVWWIILLTSRLKMCEIVDYNLIIQRGMGWGSHISSQSREPEILLMFTYFSLAQTDLLLASERASINVIYCFYYGGIYEYFAMQADLQLRKFLTVF